MHEKRVARAYFVELMTALLVYTVLLFAAIRYGRPMSDGWLRTLVLVTPMIGFGLMIWAITRHMARVDEYVRQNLLVNTALAAAITAGLTFSYGFLENAGYPRLTMFVVWPVLAMSWGVVGAVRAALRR